jgi:phosphatidylinositol-3-phosphatase
VRRRLVVLLGLLLVCLLGGAQSSVAALPPVKHVFVILLENENASSTFGANSPSPYLARTLSAQGLLLPNYYGVTHLSLGNYIALLSGQGSNPDTQADCQFYTDLIPATIGPDGQALGQGCVYPTNVKTLADQLDKKGLSWKGYMEDMGNTPGKPSTCRHPAMGARDDTQQAKAGDQYAARHNPFVYFHSIIDSPVCARNNVDLHRLPADLGSRRTVASYSFITPNLCHDAHDTPCANGEPGGMQSADLFLRHWIPPIMASPAYREGGMIVITFDEAESEPGDGDAAACCDQPQFPNTINNGGPLPGRGGGRIGAVVLSPFARAGAASTAPYNHFSMLRSMEDVFGLGHLGYAARKGLRPFGGDVYSADRARLSRLKLAPTRLKRRRGGTKISYSLTQPARVEFRVDRAGAGRRGSGGRCRRAREGVHGKRCLFWRRVRGGFHRDALLGSNSLSFSGRLRGHRLRPGLYRLVSAPNGWRGRGNRVKRRFRVAAH